MDSEAVTNLLFKLFRMPAWNDNQSVTSDRAKKTLDVGLTPVITTRNASFNYVLLLLFKYPMAHVVESF